MEIPTSLCCLFGGAVEQRDETYLIEVPERERAPSTPPVAEGEQRTVEIEDIGDQGDGITRVERGFVVIVPDTEQGERVTIEITNVAKTVAFAEVVEGER